MDIISELISIIIPVYNTERYLEKCIESILSQSYKNLEIILINDGSTDTSALICDLLCNRDNRIKVIHKTNGGVSSARNEGLKYASGDYIGFVDSDDWINKDYFETLYNAITRYDADISICGYVSEMDNGSVAKSTAVSEAIVFNNEEAIKAMFDGTIFMGHMCNKLYKKQTVKNIKFEKDIHMYEDLLFNVQTIIKSNKIVFIPSFGYHYVRHEESACNSIDNRYMSIINAYSIMKEKLNMEMRDALYCCCKSELRIYILTVIRIIENGSTDNQIKNTIVKATRDLIKNAINKRAFGLKYMSLGLLLSFGYIPFKVFYLVIGKKFL